MRRVRLRATGKCQLRSVLGAILIMALGSVFAPPTALCLEDRRITDMAGRTVTIPQKVDRVICSGSGCLRLLTYLKAHDRIVAVDSIEIKGSPIDARPYAVANPQFKNYPLFGEFRGHDNPELIAGLRPQPQVIFKIFSGRGQDPDHLQAKTGIPVIVLEYGNLTYGREKLNQALRLIAEIMDENARAEEVIALFDTLEQDLRCRTQDIPLDQRPSCYIGGLGKAGPHGFQSTEPSFAPFVFIHARNVAAPSPGEKPLSYATVAKEQVVFWNPDVIFLDVSTLRLGSEASALEQLRTDPAYRNLSAVCKGAVFGLFPYNSYNQNFESIFANAYYVGKVLYPDRFTDVEPLAKAEEISVLLNGGPAFEILNKQFSGLAFSRIRIE